MQSDDFIICEFYFLVFIEYKFAGKNLLDCTSLLSPNDH